MEGTSYWFAFNSWLKNINGNENMKKINKILLVVFFSLVLTCMSSCSGIWEPVNNNIKYKEKRNYKEYSELKEPLAFSFEINQVFSSKDRNDVGMEFGNIVYFYDTENDEVYEYILLSI